MNPHLRAAVIAALSAAPTPVTAVAREPYHPTAEDWTANYYMLCGHCTKQLHCPITEAMIELKAGGPWPEGGWVTDPGAEVTCLSYDPKTAARLPRQQLRHMLRLPEARLPAICDGCAARKGSEASVSLHTQRDYAAAVKAETPFLCHKKPGLCGGWCRAVRRRQAPTA